MCIAKEYQSYLASSIMQILAQEAHGEHYLGQTSSTNLNEIELFLNLLTLPKGSRILDVGCGTGAFSLHLAKKTDWDLVGVDISASLIDHARNQSHNLGLLERCQFYKADFTHLDSSYGKFDAILCVGSLYWGQPLDQVVVCWDNLLKQHGKLLLFSNIAVTSIQKKQQEKIGHTQFIKFNDLEHLFQSTGWKKVYHYDGTDTYIQWLKRWCFAMDVHKKQIYSEFGIEGGIRLINRFNTYLEMAQQRSVLRLILSYSKL